MSSNSLIDGLQRWRPTADGVFPGQHPGRWPGLCAQAVGSGLGGRAAVVSDVTAH